MMATNKERIIEAVKPAKTKRVVKPKIKHPDVVVQLTGRDGNAFSIMGHVSRALRRAGKDPDVVEEFMEEATRCKSYDAFLQHVMKTVTVK
jgi:hypothetical protein